MGGPRDISLSLGAMTIGAILAFAVSVSTPGVSLPAVGTILMVMGMVGLVLCLYLDWSRRRPRYEDEFVGRPYDEPYQTSEYSRGRR